MLSDIIYSLGKLCFHYIFLFFSFSSASIALFNERMLTGLKRKGKKIVFDIQHQGYIWKDYRTLTHVEEIVQCSCRCSFLFLSPLSMRFTTNKYTFYWSSACQNRRQDYILVGSLFFFSWLVIREEHIFNENHLIRWTASKMVSDYFIFCFSFVARSPKN